MASTSTGVFCHSGLCYHCSLQPLLCPRGGISHQGQHNRLVTGTRSQGSRNPEPVKAMFESMLEARLRAGGFSVVPCKTVWQTREQVIEKLGGIHDPTTGKTDETKIEAVRVQTRHEVCKRFKADVLLYPKITYVEANFSKNKAR